MSTLSNLSARLARLARRTFVPDGGTTGQVLAKSSAADGAVGWITPSGGGTEGSAGDGTTSACLVYDGGTPAAHAVDAPAIDAGGVT